MKDRNPLHHWMVKSIKDFGSTVVCREWQRVTHCFVSTGEAIYSLAAQLSLPNPCRGTPASEGIVLMYLEVHDPQQRGQLPSAGQATQEMCVCQVEAELLRGESVWTNSFFKINGNQFSKIVPILEQIRLEKKDHLWKAKGWSLIMLVLSPYAWVLTLK